jgi:hypothetical protein
MDPRDTVGAILSLTVVPHPRLIDGASGCR